MLTLQQPVRLADFACMKQFSPVAETDISLQFRVLQLRPQFFVDMGESEEADPIYFCTYSVKFLCSEVLEFERQNLFCKKQVNQVGRFIPCISMGTSEHDRIVYAFTSGSFASYTLYKHNIAEAG